MIDIKELRIGNTVLFNDKQVQVEALDISELDPFVKHYLPSIKWHHISQYKPIPITEKLLKELGFEENKSDLHFDYEKFLNDGLGIFVNKIKENLIRVEVWDNVIHRGNMLCQYLHELETFVFLTTKKELNYGKSI